jgi:predicted benzoate:H+ symporter BenE
MAADASADLERAPRRPPRGVTAADEAPRGLLPPIPVRCRKQAPGETPRFTRPRFGWDLRELSGACGDLGTFLPHVLGAIAVVGMDPTGLLLGFGIFYVVSGAYYGIPMAVQPMKAASAAVLVEPMTAGAVAGAGLIIGAVFLLLGATGLIGRLARALPPVVAAGLQLGLGMALALLGVRLMSGTPWLGGLVCLVILALSASRRWPSAPIALMVGVAAAHLAGIGAPWPELTLGFHLPEFALPGWTDLWHGAQQAALPQIPLTITNAVIVSAAVARQLYPREVLPVSERALSISTGLGNLLAAPFGGYPMCHGAGGLTAHHRFGGRTASASLAIGVLLCVLAVLLGEQAAALLRVVPDGAVGALLLFSGVELAASSRPERFAGGELHLLLLMAAIGVAVNPVAAFAVGWPLAVLIARGHLKLH